MNIQILYEDNNLLVINKPSGISVHPDGKTNVPTISDWVLEKYPKIKEVGEPLVTNIKGEEVKIFRPGIVHRLDKETSGVLIISKNQDTFKFLKKQFLEHKIEKIYNAFVYGFVSDPKASLATRNRGVINAPLGRSPKNALRWTAGRAARLPLREAVTEYVILKKFEDDGEKFSYLEVYPKTGRTHQIRIHLRYINHPIVSDPLYRGSKNLALGMNRLALHARSITFKLPDGEEKTVEAPFPADFQKAMDKYIDPRV